MEKFYVSLPKQKPFWSDHTSLKIRKLRKMLQTDPHKIYFCKLSQAKTFFAKYEHIRKKKFGKS